MPKLDIIYCVFHSQRPATKEAVVTGARNPPVCDECFAQWEAEKAQHLPYVECVVQRRLLALAQERDRQAAARARETASDSTPAALEPAGILPPHLIERENQS